MILSLAMCGMAVIIWSNVVLSANMCGMAVQFGQLVVLSLVCVVWLLQFGQTVGFERKYVWYGCYNLVNLWF